MYYAILRPCYPIVIQGRPGNVRRQASTATSKNIRPCYQASTATSKNRPPGVHRHQQKRTAVLSHRQQASTATSKNFSPSPTEGSEKGDPRKIPCSSDLHVT